MDKDQKIGAPKEGPTNRHVYLLKMWREDENAPWLIMLQSVDGKIRKTFTNMESLTSYLDSRIDI